MLDTVYIWTINIFFWYFAFFGVSATIVGLPEKIQRKIFNHESKFYRVSKREMKFYRAIKLPKWKDKLPQKNTDFEKRHLPDVITEDYLRKYIFVTCRSEVIHYAIGIFGYLSIFFSFLSKNVKEWLGIYSIISTLMMIGNLPFSMIQRYNRFRLTRLRSKWKSETPV